MEYWVNGIMGILHTPMTIVFSHHFIIPSFQYSIVTSLTHFFSPRTPEAVKKKTIRP